MRELAAIRRVSRSFPGRSGHPSRAWAALLGVALVLVGPEAMALDSVGSKDGESCTIDRNGLKIPGTVKNGECCSTLKADDCVVILKPFPGSVPTVKPITPARPTAPVVSVPPAGTAGAARP